MRLSSTNRSRSDEWFACLGGVRHRPPLAAGRTTPAAGPGLVRTSMPVQGRRAGIDPSIDPMKGYRQGGAAAQEAEAEGHV